MRSMRSAKPAKLDSMLLPSWATVFWRGVMSRAGELVGASGMVASGAAGSDTMSSCALTWVTMAPS